MYNVYLSASPEQDAIVTSLNVAMLTPTLLSEHNSEKINFSSIVHSALQTWSVCSHKPIDTTQKYRTRTRAAVDESTLLFTRSHRLWRYVMYRLRLCETRLELSFTIAESNCYSNRLMKKEQ